MFYLNVYDQGSITHVDVAGRIDALNAREFGQELLSLISAGQINLTLRLSALEYMSSAGLREIVRVFKIVENLGGEFRVIQPSSAMMRILQTTGLDTIVM